MSYTNNGKHDEHVVFLNKICQIEPNLSHKWQDHVLVKDNIVTLCMPS